MLTDVFCGSWGSELWSLCLWRQNAFKILCLQHVLFSMETQDLRAVMSMKWGGLDVAVLDSPEISITPSCLRTCLHGAGRQYLVRPRLPLLSAADSQWMWQWSIPSSQSLHWMRKQRNKKIRKSNKAKLHYFFKRILFNFETMRINNNNDKAAMGWRLHI